MGSSQPAENSPNPMSETCPRLFNCMDHSPMQDLPNQIHISAGVSASHPYYRIAQKLMLTSLFFSRASDFIYKYRF